MKYDQNASDTPEACCMPTQPAARIDTKPMVSVSEYVAGYDRAGETEAQVKQPEFQKTP